METHAHRRASSDIFDTRCIGCNASTLSLEDYGNIGAGLDRRIAKVCPMIAVLALYVDVRDSGGSSSPSSSSRRHRRRRRRRRLAVVNFVVALVIVVAAFVVVLVVVESSVESRSPSCKRFGKTRRPEKLDEIRSSESSLL